MHYSTRTVATTLALALALSTLAACFEPDDGADLAVAQVELVATAAADVDHFFLLVRPVSIATWTQTLLPAVVSGTDAVAISQLVLAPGPYVFRAEAYDVSNNLLGFPREVRVDLIAGVSTQVAIALDLSDFGDGEGDANAQVVLVAQNGADIDQSSITDANPMGSEATTITIDSATDYEGDQITTGFIGMPGPAREWVGGDFTYGPYTFSLDENGAENQIIMAFAVDSSGMGTGHLYKFNTTANPTLTEVETVRIHDLVIWGSLLTRLVVFSRADGTYFVRAESDQDYVVDFEINNGELLSWGLLNGTSIYQVRSRLPDGSILVTDFNMATGFSTFATE
jgi:hypothetical protein